MTATPQPFRAIHACELAAVDLRAELDQHGYALIRAALSPTDLNPLRSDITAILAAANWFAPSSDPNERLANPSVTCWEDDPAFKLIYDQVFALPSFHALPHHPALQRVMKLLTGPELLIHPKSAARLVFPNFEPARIRAHQDHTAVAGNPDSYTAWMPLHDCPAEQGSLEIFAGSHRFGLQPSAGQTGYITPGTERGDGWVGGDIHAGDILLFHSLTVHQAALNRSDYLRLSLDCRFQSALHAVNPGVLVFTEADSTSWDAIYANWPDDPHHNALRYYWTNLPLELRPSISELAELTTTAGTPAWRDRYARILERIESQLALQTY